MAKVMYERMERYNYLTGEYQGSHVKLYDNVTMREGDAMSYATAEALGFTQTDILTQVQIGAVAAADAANAALETEKAAHDVTQAALVAEQSAHAATTDQLNVALAKLTAAGIP